MISDQYAKTDIAKGTLPCGKKYIVFSTANFKKPERVPAIFDCVLGNNVPREKVLMVSDTLGTDILGANRAGIKTCLTIEGGETEVKMLESGVSVDADGIKVFIKASRRECRILLSAEFFS